MVLLVCDVVAGPERPLTYLVGALTPVLEGLLVIIVVAGVEMGALLKPSVAIAGSVSPASLAIVVDLGRRPLRHQPGAEGSPLVASRCRAASPGRRHRARPASRAAAPVSAPSTARVAVMFGAACAVVLVAGVMLEESGNELANRVGVNGVIFGATVLAAATALPEISSGIAAVRLGDNALAMGDIFGGNAFQVCLFLVADLVAGKPVLPTAGPLNAWLAALGVGAHGGLRLRRDQPAEAVARDSARTRSSRSACSVSASRACSSSRASPAARP